jgi:pectate lyase
MLGYATIESDGIMTTTGGDGGLTIHVNNIDELKQIPTIKKNNDRLVVIINGIFYSDESIQIKFKNGCNLSIIGDNADLKNIGFSFDNFNNVIIRNMVIHEVFYPNDPITINNSHHFYIYDNEFYSVNNEDTHKDTYDGIIDIKRGSKCITIDSNYIHDHNKCILIGHTNDLNQMEQDSKISVTICNNHFKNITTRCPSIRYGTLHVFNNKYEDIHDYAIACRLGANVLIENNTFINTKHVITEKFDNKHFVNNIQLYNNIYIYNELNNKRYIEYMNMCNVYRKTQFNTPYDY